MDIWLVIDESDDQLIAYKDRYKAFHTSNDALEYAKSIGLVDAFDIGFDERKGFLNNYIAGDVKVLAIKVEVQ